MFTIPTRQRNLTTVYPTAASMSDVAMKIPKPWTYYVSSLEKTQRRGQIGQGTKELIAEAFKGKNIASLTKDIFLGKVGASVKTQINKASGVKNQRPAFEGEKHAFFVEKNREGKKRLVFASYMGPSTQFIKRIKRRDNPINLPDQVAMAHDARYGLARTTDDLRSADQMMVKKLKEIRQRGNVSKINTDIGLRGIQLKMQLENTGLLSKKKFLGPLTNQKEIAMTRSLLGKLEQKGFGTHRGGFHTLPRAFAEELRRRRGGRHRGFTTLPFQPQIQPFQPPITNFILPGQELKKRILRKLKTKKGKGIYGGRVAPFLGKAVTLKGGRGIKARSIISKKRYTSITPVTLARMIATKMFPTFIKQIAAASGVRPKQMGSGPRRSLIRVLTAAFKKIKRRQKGGIFGITIAGIAALAGIIGAVAPLAIQAGKFLIPKIVSAFKRKPGGRFLVGSGIMNKLRALLSKASSKVIRKFCELVCAGRQVGSGFLDFIKGVGKDFVSRFTKTVIGKKLVSGLTNIVGKIRGVAKLTPEMIAKMLAQKFLPNIIQQIAQKTGTRPKQMGSGPRKALIRKLTVAFRKIKRRQKGGIFGITLAGVAALAGIIGAVAPLAIQAGKFLIPKIVSAFKRKPGGRMPGGGIMDRLRNLLSQASGKVIKKFCELVCAGRQIGQGFKSFIKGVTKKFVKGLSTALKITKGVAEFGFPIAKAAAPVLVKHGLPLLLKLFTKGK